MFIFIPPQPGKVSVNITVQSFGEVRSEIDALVWTVDEVADDSLEGLTV